MKTDRELLELAAKAAGYRITINFYGVMLRDKNEQGLEFCAWNPLTDDGDALRLLAALPSLWTLSTKFGPYVHLSVAWGTGAGIQQVNPSESGDVAAALRRVIVCVAADVAINMN